MSFAWTEFLQLAQALERDPINPGPEEASLRCAISRAYYAAFIMARNFGRNNGEFVPTGTGSDHSLVKKHFMSSSNRTRKKIGTDLDRLLYSRTLADYEDILQSNAASMARSSVTRASNVINRLNKI